MFSTVVLLFLYLGQFAQVFEFQVLNQQNGLPSSVITALMQDSRKLIWIGTDGAGLVKYDGTHFKIYDQSNGLAGCFVTDVIEDSNANLVLASRYNGISVFDGRFFFKVYNKRNSKIQSSTFKKLIKTSKGVYGLGEKDIVLIRPNYSLDYILHHNNLLQDINSVVQTVDLSLLIGTANGLYQLKDKILTRIFESELKGLVSIIKNNEGKIICASSAGVFIINESNSINTQLQKFRELPPDFSPKQIFVSKRGSIWLGGEGNQGLIMIDGERLNRFNEAKGFTGETVNCFMQDEGLNLYIGTEGTGLFRTGRQQFVNYTNQKILNSSLIFSIIKDSLNLYVGVRKSGIYKYKSTNASDLEFVKAFENGTGANCLTRINTGEILAGTNTGLYKLSKDKLININIPTLNEGKKRITVIVQDSKNRLLIGTYGNGLLITDNSFKTLKHFTTTEAVFADYVHTINQVAIDKWYLGTNNGLYLLNEKGTNNFELSEKLIADVISISTKDSYGNYWFVGSDCIYALTKRGIKKYDKKSGLTSTLIYTLIADKQGSLWSGSNLGLDKIEVNQSGNIVSVINYDYKKGFKGLETNMRAQFRDNDGNLYLGTVNGLVKCLVNYTTVLSSTPKAVISNLKLANQEHDWLSNTSKNKWVNLPDSGHVFNTSENQFTFEFNAINVGFNKHFNYSYKLDGADKNWSYPSSINEVSYSNLKPGNYTFRVKLADTSINPTTNQEAAFTFSIKMPFYQNWWFIIGVSLLFVITIFSLFAKFSTYNSDFVFDKSSHTNYDELRLYILCLGVVAPLSELFIEIFNIRQNSELLANIIIGFILILAYYMSHKSAFVRRNLYSLAVIIIFGFFANSAYKIAIGNTELITITEYLIVLFFSFVLFKNMKYHWTYMGIVFAYVVFLFFTPQVSIEMALVIANASTFIVMMNYAAHISKLNNSEKLLFTSNIINNGNSLAIATNKMGELSYCSNNIIKILGYTPEEVMGLGFWHLTEDKDFEYSDYSKKFVKDNIYIRKLKCKDGTYKYIQWIDTKHTENLYVGIGQDVTERIKIQELYQNMVQNAADLIFETDVNGYFTFVNNVVTDILGYTPEELKGKRFITLIRPDYIPQIFRLYFVSVPEGNYFEIIEFPVIGKNKEEHWVSQKVSVKRDDTGVITGYSSIVRDITKLKQIEIQNNKRQERRNNYNAVLNKLSTDPNTSHLSFKEAVNQILNKAALVLNANRLSIWRNYSHKVKCSFEVVNGTTQSILGDELRKARLPVYFKAIEEGVTIIASDVENHELTKELIVNHPGKARSLLDVPIFSNAELTGIVCCDMTEAHRIWETEDVDFLRSIADIISVLFETRKRQKIEKQLAFRNEISLAVATTTEKLLVSEDINYTLQKYIGIITNATRVSRVYYYENNTQTRILTLKAQACKNGVLPLAGSRHEQFAADSLGPASAYIRANQLYEGLRSKVNHQVVTAWLDEKQSLSTIILPVYGKDGLYGILGFDDCEKERIWADSHLVIIKALVDNIANAIDRINSDYKIKESESNFRQINETIRDVFWLYDSVAKKYLYVSPNAEEIVGISAKEFYDGSYRNRALIFEEDLPRRMAAQLTMEEMDYYEVEYRIKTENGGFKWINEKSFAIRNVHGELIRNSGTCRDITEKKKVETELKQLSIVAEKTTNGVLICEADGKVIWANQGFLDLFEISLENLQGKYPRDLFLPEGGLTEQEIDKLNGISFTRELRLKTTTNKLKWVEINSTKIFDEYGKVQQQIEVITDITERVEHRSTLLRYSNDLEFQSTLQRKIINAHTYEELTIETLGFIYHQIKDCIRISLVSVDQKHDFLTGHALVDNKLEKVSYKASQTRSYSTILNGETFVMSDLMSMEYKSASDLNEMAQGVASYVIIPIMDGSKLIGALNIAFNKVLSLSQNQIANLESFSVLFSVALRQLELKRELSLRNKNIVESLGYAKYIQNAVLPDIKNMPEEFNEVGLYFRPKDIVSGDFYWAKKANGFTYLALADCTGHGVPGAFLTLIGSRILEEVILTEKLANPSDILKKLDEQLYYFLNSRQKEIIRDGMEIGLCVIDKENNKMYYAGSGRGLLCFKNEEEYYIPGQRRIIGNYDRVSTGFITSEIELSAYDVYYMFTDGFYDQLDSTGHKRYTKKRFMKFLKSLSSTPVESMEALMDAEIEQHRGDYKQTDDISVISFRINIDKQQNN